MSAVEDSANPSPVGAVAPAAPPVFGMNGARLHTVDGGKLTPYNFRNPGFLSAADLRHLSMLHQRYVQHLSARLSTFLRMECVLKTTEFNSSTFSGFCDLLPTPSHLTLFQVDPLRGVGIVDLSLPLGLAMADRLLGGKGNVSESDRALTEIEVALLEDAMQLVITEWTQLWNDDDAWVLQPHCVGHETSARFLQTSAPDAVFVVTSVEMTLGDIVDQFHLGIPFSMIETMVKKMQQARHHGETKGTKLAQWRGPYAGITVPVTAEWQLHEITLAEALALRAGAVIDLPRELIDRTRIRLSTTEEFVGRVGVQNGNVAVQLTQRALKD